MTEITIRMAGSRDRTALRRLASLDSRLPLRGPAVVAEVNGELLAAIPLDGGPGIADPFRRSAHLLRLLELRAGQLSAPASAAEHTPLGARPRPFSARAA